MGVAPVGLITRLMANPSRINGSTPRTSAAIRALHVVTLSCTPPTTMANPLRMSNITSADSSADSALARR